MTLDDYLEPKDPLSRLDKFMIDQHTKLAQTWQNWTGTSVDTLIQASAYSGGIGWLINGSSLIQRENYHFAALSGIMATSCFLNGLLYAKNPELKKFDAAFHNDTPSIMKLLLLGTELFGAFALSYTLTNIAQSKITPSTISDIGIGIALTSTAINAYLKRSDPGDPPKKPVWQKVKEYFLSYIKQPAVHSA
jgi:hypothetical protein